MTSAPIRLHLPNSLDCREEDVRDVAIYIADQLQRSDAIAAARPLAPINPDPLGFRAVVAAAPELDGGGVVAVHAVLVRCRGAVHLLNNQDVAAWLADQAPGAFTDPRTFSVLAEHVFLREMRIFDIAHVIDRLTDPRADQWRRHPWPEAGR